MKVIMAIMPHIDNMDFGQYLKYRVICGKVWCHQNPLWKPSGFCPANMSLSLKNLHICPVTINKQPVLSGPEHPCSSIVLVVSLGLLVFCVPLLAATKFHLSRIIKISWLDETFVVFSRVKKSSICVKRSQHGKFITHLEKCDVEVYSDSRVLTGLWAVFQCHGRIRLSTLLIQPH